VNKRYFYETERTRNAECRAGKPENRDLLPHGAEAGEEWDLAVHQVRSAVQSLEGTVREDDEGAIIQGLCRMNRQAKIYLLAVDVAEHKILMQLPDTALVCVEKVKTVFGKEARVVAHKPPSSPMPTEQKHAQQKLL
jgi:hypothetical protein